MQYIHGKLTPARQGELPAGSLALRNGHVTGELALLHLFDTICSRGASSGSKHAFNVIVWCRLGRTSMDVHIRLQARAACCNTPTENSLGPHMLDYWQEAFGGSPDRTVSNSDRTLSASRTLRRPPGPAPPAVSRPPPPPQSRPVTCQTLKLVGHVVPHQHRHHITLTCRTLPLNTAMAWSGGPCTSTLHCCCLSLPAHGQTEVLSSPSLTYSMYTLTTPLAACSNRALVRLTTP
jgi:hypothetical protein